MYGGRSESTAPFKPSSVTVNKHDISHESNFQKLKDLNLEIDGTATRSTLQSALLNTSLSEAAILP